MAHLIGQLLNTADSYLANLMKYKVVRDSDKSISLFKSKEDLMKEFEIESENVKKLVKYCKKWVMQTESLKRSYQLAKTKYEKALISSEKVGEECSCWCPKVE